MGSDFDDTLIFMRGQPRVTYDFNELRHILP